jgi:hypothetical protein
MPALIPVVLHPEQHVPSQQLRACLQVHVDWVLRSLANIGRIRFRSYAGDVKPLFTQLSCFGSGVNEHNFKLQGEAAFLRTRPTSCHTLHFDQVAQICIQSNFSRVLHYVIYIVTPLQSTNH